MKEKIRIGCGAGFSGDRLEPALVLAEKGELDYLVLECLAERTIALAQKRKLQDPTQGYDPLLERRMEALLPLLAKHDIRLITNMGAANPLEGAKKIIAIAQKQGIAVKVAAVTGDDLTATLSSRIAAGEMELMEANVSKTEIMNPISANAYLGIEAIRAALQTGARIVITGRVADPSLFLAPMVHEFGWKTDEYELLGKGTVIGHLMECAGHITGGYYADPIKKPVPNMDTLGHPFADVYPDGTGIISKVAGTGGIINLRTAKEQLLYEVVNPYEYITPDVIADFTSVQLTQVGENQVRVTGGGGKARPQTYKVSVGYRAYYLGEGEISYAGPAALERAQLAGQILEKRLHGKFPELVVDHIGMSSVFRGSNVTSYDGSLPEVRLRVAAKARTLAEAALVGEEVEALYTNGPAGGGGVRKYTNEVIGIVSVLVNRTQVIPRVTLFNSDD